MTLPVALIISHASLACPPEIADRVALTSEDIFNEADVYTDQIFDLGDAVAETLVFPYARCFVDVNRPNDTALVDHPGLWRSGDGIIKRQTSYGVPVFKPGMQPDEAFEQTLIGTYWQTWHAQLERIANDPRIKLVIDCHSMAAQGPSHYSDPGALRPRTTVSNMGDAAGELESLRNRLTAPPALTRTFGRLLGEAVAGFEPLTPVGIPNLLNTPFWGGWNVWSHGGTRQPWLMIEFNRGLYVGEQTAASPVRPPDQVRIAALRQSFRKALRALVADAL
jgi:N-formylglutamate deformylase